jgi:hypothetical protein
MENKKHPKKETSTKQPIPNKGVTPSEGSKSAGSKMYPDQQPPSKGDKK